MIGNRMRQNYLQELKNFSIGFSLVDQKLDTFHIKNH